jgi:excisionase family DNA binding protein
MKRKQTKKVPDRASLQPLSALERYTIDEAAAYLRMSRVTIYKHVSLGDLKVIKDGGRTYVPGSEIVRRSTLASPTA